MLHASRVIFLTCYFQDTLGFGNTSAQVPIGLVTNAPCTPTPSRTPTIAHKHATNHIVAILALFCDLCRQAATRALTGRSTVVVRDAGRADRLRLLCNFAHGCQVDLPLPWHLSVRHLLRPDGRHSGALLDSARLVIVQSSPRACTHAKSACTRAHAHTHIYTRCT